MKRPRIAFCFSGQARTLDYTYIFFKQNLFDAASEQGFDYDIFCAIEDDDDAYKVDILSPTIVEKSHHDEIAKIINNKYGKSRQNSFLKKYRRPKGFCACPIEQFLQQLYKVSRSFSIKKQYEIENKINYDIVLKLRFDTPFFNKLNFEKINNTLKPNSILTTFFYDGKNIFLKKMSKKLFIIKDFFFIGKYNSLDCLSEIFESFEEGFLGSEIGKHKIIFHFCNLIENIIKYINDKIGANILPTLQFFYVENIFYKVFSPERFYYNYLSKNNLKIICENFSFFLIRKKIEESISRFNQKNLYEL